MGRVAENVSAPFFVSEASHSVAIDGLIPNSFADCYITSFARYRKKIKRADTSIFLGIPPDRLLDILQVLKRESLQFRLLDPEEMIGENVECICCTPDEKMASLEYHLAEAALATKARCPLCLKTRVLVPLSNYGNTRQIVHWCKNCNETVDPVIKPEDYKEIPFPTSGVPKVPIGSGATLRGHVTAEDLRWHMQHLGRRKAPGADGIPNEFLIDAPESLFTIILDCVNSLLAQDEKDRIPVPKEWKDGLIHNLYKGGSPTKHSNWRPVTLLRTIYKIYSAIITDRLYKLASAFKLIHPSQEGFQRDHCTQRNVQSLLWAYEQARKDKQTLIVHFIDFSNAFNSMDHQALWRWLEEINIPDIDLM
jgi:hypothetical protein